MQAGTRDVDYLDFTFLKDLENASLERHLGCKEQPSGCSHLIGIRLKSYECSQ